MSRGDDSYQSEANYNSERSSAIERPPREGHTSRRMLLKLSGTAAIGAAVGTTPASAQADTQDVDIRYSSEAQTSDSPRSDLDIPTDDGTGVVVSQNIQFKVFGELDLNPEINIRIRNTDTGAELDLTPETTQIVPDGNRVSLARTNPVYDVEGDVREDAEIEVLVDEDAFEWEPVSVTVDGDTDVFTGGDRYAMYEIEVTGADGGPLAATDKTPIGVGIERGFIQQEGTSGEVDFSLSVAAPIDTEYFLTFDAAGFADEGFELEETVIESDGTTTLEWTADLSESEPGTYNRWKVSMWPDSEAPDDQPVILFFGEVNEADAIVVEQDATESVEIDDWNGLNDVRENVDGDYVLVNDLDEDTAGYDDHVATQEGGFEPIGNESAFTGTFDGNGNEIANIVIDRPDEESVGLFGTADDAVIEDVVITDAEVTGESDVGTTVGTAEGSTSVETVTASGTVEGSDDEIGGIVGQSRNAVVVSDADSAVDLTGRDDVGGVVGENDDEATIRNSVASGTVEWRPDGAEISFGTSLGGIVGDNDSADATVEDCRSEADVNVLDNYEWDEESDENGVVHAGVIAGLNDGLIERCTTSGTVTVENNPQTGGENFNTNVRIGGIVGNNSGGDPVEGRVRQCSSAATVIATDSDLVNAGGITGTNFGTIEDCYATGAVDVAGGDFPEVGGLVGENSGGFESDGVVERCFAAVAFSVDVIEGAARSVGGVIGDNRSDTVASDLYWDTDVSDVEEGIDGEDGDITNIIGLSAADAQGEAAVENMAALDFDETWDSVVDPDAYPILAWQDGSIDDPTDEEIEGDVTITLDNVGTSAWEVTGIDGDDEVASVDVDNPTLTLEPETRYVIENNGWDAHPLAFRDADGEGLLTQDGDGEYETDPDVDWADTGSELAFSLTGELASELDRYICTNHSSMVGEVNLADEGADDGQHESGVSEELFDAVNDSGGDELERDDIRNMIQGYAQEGNVNGVPLNRDDVRDIIQFYAQQ